MYDQSKALHRRDRISQFAVRTEEVHVRRKKYRLIIVAQELDRDLPYFSGVCEECVYIADTIKNDTHRAHAAFAVRADELERHSGVGVDRYCLAFEFGLGHTETADEEYSYAMTCAEYCEALCRRLQVTERDSDRVAAVMRARCYIVGQFPADKDAPRA